MKILIVNSLDARYGSTYRLRAIRDRLAKDHTVEYIEHEGSAFGKLWHAKRAALFSSYDLLITQKFNPITLSCLFIARLRRKPTLVDWDDLDVGLQSNVFKRALSKICEWIGPHFATHLTTHNDAILAHAQKLRPTIRLDQGFDPAIFHPHQDPQRARSHWKIPPGVHVVGHLCTFTHGGAMDLDLILKAWSQMLTPHVVFMLIGGGPLEGRIARKLFEYGLQSRVIRTGLLDRKEAAQALSCLDVATVFMSDTPSNRARVSLKVIESLASGIPVVGYVVGETRALLGSHVIEPEGDLAVTLEIVALGQKPDPVSMEAFTWEKTLQPLTPWIDQIGKEHGINP